MKLIHLLLIQVNMRLYFVFLLVLSGSVIVNGQTARFDHFDISNGLSQNNINGLVIDDKGNVWAGTLDGLNKYNGYNFEVFKPQSPAAGGISGNHIIAMGKGLNGDVWITDREGVLNQYQSSLKKFRSFDSDIFAAEGIVPENNLMQFNDSLLLFSQGSRVGVLNIDNEQFQTFNAPGYVHGIGQKGDSLLIYGAFGILSCMIEYADSSLVLKSIKKTSVPCFFLQKDRSRWLVVSNDGVYVLKNDFWLIISFFSF